MKRVQGKEVLLQFFSMFMLILKMRYFYEQHPTGNECFTN